MKVLGAILLAVGASAQVCPVCPSNFYFSKNTNGCVKSKEQGAYCNAIQSCAPGMKCDSNVCTPSCASTGSPVGCDMGGVKDAMAAVQDFFADGMTDGFANSVGMTVSGGFGSFVYPPSAPSTLMPAMQKGVLFGSDSDQFLVGNFMPKDNMCTSDSITIGGQVQYFGSFPTTCTTEMCATDITGAFFAEALLDVVVTAEQGMDGMFKITKLTIGFSGISQTPVELPCLPSQWGDIMSVQNVVTNTYFAAVHSGDNATLNKGWHPEAHLRSSWPAVAFYEIKDASTWPGDYINPDWSAEKFGEVVYNDPPCVDYYQDGDGEPTNDGNTYPVHETKFTCVAPDIFLSVERMSESTALVKALIAAEGFYYTDMLTLGFFGAERGWLIITKSTTEQGPTVMSPYWVERKSSAFGTNAEGGAASFGEIASVAASYMDAIHSKNTGVLNSLMEAASGVYSVDSAYNLNVMMKSTFINSLPSADTSDMAKQFDKITCVTKNSMRGSIATIQYKMGNVFYNENLSIYDFATNGGPANPYARSWKIMSITKGVAVDGIGNKYNYAAVGKGSHLDVMW